MAGPTQGTAPETPAEMPADTPLDAPVAIVIPARYASTRYPGKPLAMLSGRSLLERSIRAARAAARTLPGGAAVWVATDDDRIRAEAARCDTAVIMTDPGCPNGTARVAQAVARAGLTAQIVVNLQGDAPLTPPHFVTALVAAMRDAPARQVATPVLRCDAEALANFREDRRNGRVGATTVVRARDGAALYFSKEVLPYADGLGADGTGPDGQVPVFHHVGLYAYRPAALTLYDALPAGPLEAIEGLEQLRFLENGHPVHCVEVEARGAAFWELNNPSDVALIEGYLARMGVD